MILMVMVVYMVGGGLHCWSESGWVEAWCTSSSDEESPDDESLSDPSLVLAFMLLSLDLSLIAPCQ